MNKTSRECFDRKTNDRKGKRVNIMAPGHQRGAKPKKNNLVLCNKWATNHTELVVCFPSYAHLVVSV